MSLIRFLCPGCSREMKIDASHGGKQARCPKCSAAFMVPFQGAPVPKAPERPSRAWLEEAASLPSRSLAIPEEVEICPLCRVEMTRASRLACACGKVFCSKRCVAEHIDRDHVRSRVRSAFLAIVGVVLFVAGFLGLAVYWMMDTSVSIGGGQRIHNIGLMQEQRNGMMVSLAGLGLGLVLCIYGGGRPKVGPA